MMSEMTVGDLQNSHMAKRVTVVTGDATIEGVLHRLTIDHPMIDVSRAAQMPGSEYIPGPQVIALKVGRWSADQVPQDAKVVVHDE